MQEFQLITSLPENIWLSEGWFFWGFPRAQSALSLISTLNYFQGVLKVSSLHGHDVIFVEAAGKCHLPVSRVPSWPYIQPCFGAFHGHVSRGAGKAHSQVYRRFHWWATQCAVTRPSLASGKSLWTIPVLPASWSTSIIPLVLFSHI